MKHKNMPDFVKHQRKHNLSHSRDIHIKHLDDEFEEKKLPPLKSKDVSQSFDYEDSKKNSISY